MKLLLDEGLPRGAADLLRQRGVDALHVADILGTGTPDELILRTALNDGRVLITLDADFHAILAQSQMTQPSVIRIRIEGLKSQPLVSLIVSAIEGYPDELASGVAVSIDTQFMRFRKLPLR